MRRQIRDLVLGIGLSAVFIVVVMIVLTSATRNREFDYQVFQQYLPTYREQDATYEETKLEVEEYMKLIMESESPENISESIYDILPETDLNISYVSCSDDQVREAAQDAIEIGKAYFDSEEVVLVEAVYAIEERVAVYLESPRSYLYFIMTEDEEKMVGMTMNPTEEGYDIQPLWGVERSGDDEYVIQETNRYRFLYTNQIF